MFLNKHFYTEGAGCAWFQRCISCTFRLNLSQKFVISPPIPSEPIPTCTPCPHTIPLRQLRSSCAPHNCTPTVSYPAPCRCTCCALHLHSLPLRPAYSPCPSNLPAPPAAASAVPCPRTLPASLDSSYCTLPAPRGNSYCTLSQRRTCPAAGLALHSLLHDCTLLRRCLPTHVCPFPPSPSLPCPAHATCPCPCVTLLEAHPPATSWTTSWLGAEDPRVTTITPPL